ncbi:MAG: hypothetical protein JOY85_18770, partial [Acidobacteriaceae bacterium]|nr:hypothetical protein [Acidobacteriaceae bacterium]
MRFLRMIRHRFRSLLRRSNTEADMERELEIHLEQLTKEHITAGMNVADARRAARRAFGSLELTKEQCRDTRAVQLVEDLLRDLAYA